MSLLWVQSLGLLGTCTAKALPCFSFDLVSMICRYLVHPTVSDGAVQLRGLSRITCTLSNDKWSCMTIDARGRLWLGSELGRTIHVLTTDRHCVLNLPLAFSPLALCASDSQVFLLKRKDRKTDNGQVVALNLDGKPVCEWKELSMTLPQRPKMSCDNQGSVYLTTLTGAILQLNPEREPQAISFSVHVRQPLIKSALVVRRQQDEIYIGSCDSLVATDFHGMKRRNISCTANYIHAIGFDAKDNLVVANGTQLIWPSFRALKPWSYLRGNDSVLEWTCDEPSCPESVTYARFGTHEDEADSFFCKRHRRTTDMELSKCRTADLCMHHDGSINVLEQESGMVFVVAFESIQS